MDYKHLVWLAAAAAALTLARLAVPDDAAPQGSLATAASVLGPAPAADSGPKAEPDAQPHQPAGPASAAAAAPSTQPPYGLSPEQWQQLQQALADHPQRDAEIARIGAYMQYMGTALDEGTESSAETRETIDAEVRRLVGEQFARAQALLTAHRDALSRLSTDLLKAESLDGSAVREALANAGQAFGPDSEDQRGRTADRLVDS